MKRGYGRLVMAYIVLIPIAWAAGVAAYVLTCLLFFGQLVSNGDLQAITFWSALAFTACLPVLYFPALYALRASQGSCHRVTLFAIVPATLGVVPTVLILFAFGGNFAELASSQAFLFICLFGVAGVVLGLSFAYMSNWSA